MMSGAMLLPAEACMDGTPDLQKRMDSRPPIGSGTSFAGMTKKKRKKRKHRKLRKTKNDGYFLTSALGHPNPQPPPYKIRTYERFLYLCGSQVHFREIHEHKNARERHGYENPRRQQNSCHIANARILPPASKELTPAEYYSFYDDKKRQQLDERLEEPRLARGVWARVEPHKIRQQQSQGKEYDVSSRTQDISEPRENFY